MLWIHEKFGCSSQEVCSSSSGGWPNIGEHILTSCLGCCLIGLRGSFREVCYSFTGLQLYLGCSVAYCLTFLCQNMFLASGPYYVTSKPKKYAFFSRLTDQPSSSSPEGPSTQCMRLLVPKTIP